MKKITFENLVIGSGISSTAVTISLLKKRKKVTLVSPSKDFTQNSNTEEILFCEEGLPLPNIKVKNWKKFNHIKLMQKNFLWSFKFLGSKIRCALPKFLERLANKL